MITPKNEKLMTIYGEAEFIFLNKRDTAFGEPGEYKVTLKVPRAKSGELIRDINEVIATEIGKGNPANAFKSLVEQAKKPYKVIGEEVHFKAHSQYKPVLWDKDQNKLNEKINVWKGSTMWANCKASGYTKALGTGATLLLGSVQIDHLVEGAGNGSDTCPFPKRKESLKKEIVKDLKNQITESALPAPEKGVAL